LSLKSQIFTSRTKSGFKPRSATKSGREPAQATHPTSDASCLSPRLWDNSKHIKSNRPPISLSLSWLSMCFAAKQENSKHRTKMRYSFASAFTPSQPHHRITREEFQYESHPARLAARHIRGDPPPPVAGAPLPGAFLLEVLQLAFCCIHGF